jgi:hypothetical protein
MRKLFLIVASLQCLWGWCPARAILPFEKKALIRREN